MKKTLLVLLVALMAIVTIVSCSKNNEKSDLEYVQAKGTFVLGLDDSFPPMGYRDENNEIVGFDVDVAKEVCKRLGLELILQPIDWNAKEQELNTKQIDCIWNGFTVTDERRENMTFSDSYVENAQVIIVKEKSKFQKPLDLAGKKIGLQAGSSAQEAVDDTPEFKNAIGEVVEFAENLSALMDLEVGGCDAVVMDLLVANFAIEGKPFRILKDGLAAEEYAIGFRKGDVKLAGAVNEKMLEMAQDGTMAKIATKWFGSDITIIGK